MQENIDLDPIGAWEQLQDNLKRYIKSAFGTNSPSFESERQKLLDTPGVLFQEQYLEMLQSYSTGKRLMDLDEVDLPGMSDAARRAFRALAGAELMPATATLYVHQQRMLKAALQRKHCVVVTGTGSGKTESFLLPVLASIVKDAVDGPSRWPRILTANAAPWTEANPPPWDLNRPSARGESRTSAVRALLLYPMNALVEDQLSRLRVALDSDSTHAVMDADLAGNRIRFGRYNGSTPVAGHPWKLDAKGVRVANTPKRAELKDDFKAAIAQHNLLKQRAQQADAALGEAIKSGTSQDVEKAKRQLEEIREQVSFIPRMELSSGEMFHRWEMQQSPPDLLITNISMLSIMLMRHPHNGIPDDRADSQIFESTRIWLEGDRENRTFQLVIDELHLYRGAAGTEVGYLIRLLIDRLGLSPDSRQLQVLASSASLDGASTNTYEFLGGLFGLEPEQARNRFFIENGEGVFNEPNVEPALSDSLVEKCARLGNDPTDHKLGSLTAMDLFGGDEAGEQISRFAAGFWDHTKKRHRAYSISSLSQKWFQRLENPLKRLAASRGLLVAGGVAARLSSTGQLPPGLQLPRVRFHWMVKNVDGLWATAALCQTDERRRVGQLLAEPRMSVNGKRVLEVLYCECCGTQFLAGYKTQAEQRRGRQRFELAPMPPSIEGLPESTPQTRTDSQPYLRLGVVYLVPDAWTYPADADALEWKQGSEERNEQRGRVLSKDARWVEAVLDQTSGIVEIGGIQKDGWLKCLWFHVDTDESDIPPLPAMPQMCPSCSINYSDRKGGRSSPIRSFATGLTQTSLLLTKHLMAVMPEGTSRRLVAFSDSRQSAATLANGVETEQWRHLLSTFVIQELRKRASGGLQAIQLSVLKALKACDDVRVRTIILGSENLISDEEKEALLVFRSAAKSVIEDGDLAASSAKQQVIQVETYKPGYVRLDDFLNDPNPNVAELPPIWRRLAELGVNPAGPGVDARRISQTEDWTSLIKFDSVNDTVHPQIQGVPLSTSRTEKLAGLSIRLKTQAWRAISGRLLYNLEAQGLGHLAVSPGFSASPPQGISPQSFREICDSVVRLLSEARRTDPFQGDSPPTPWQQDQPKGSSREGVDKKRTVKYLQACASVHGTSWQILRDRVREALVGEGHQIGQGWGIIRMSQLWVYVVPRDAKPWVCGRCTQIHWHASGGVCARCHARLGPSPNGMDAAEKIEQRHYYSHLSTQAGSTFRIHAEELTGQTADQAQRQRHFRNIFFDRERIDDVVPRDVVAHVDAIDLLSVTTTMEVGVDIGGLQSIFQANMPPERFNYQQRAGRAGRKRQAFSVVLTYCRGQTHDRIHFDHPEEMTSGIPPQPSVSVSDDQRILAERLVAKEVLRRAFNASGSTWASSGVPADTHGEMGTVAQFIDNQAYRDTVNQWLLTHGTEIDSVAMVVSRGTRISHLDLVSSSNNLSERILAAAKADSDRSRGLAHALADAGILPMYGMPSAIRSLYFSLPDQPTHGREPKTLDRTLDQAVTEFAPGSERTWDKRLLTPKGLVGPIQHERNSKWKSSASPIGEVTWQIFCKACRNLNVYRANSETLEPLEPMAGWDRQWLSSTTQIACPTCQDPEANVYLAVTPNGFLTDFNLNIPAGTTESNRGGNPTAFIASPSIASVPHATVGRALIALSSQKKVYRIGQNSAGKSFGFSRTFSQIQNDRYQQLEASIWAANEDGPHILASLASPKTTDILSARMLDGAGLGFFDAHRELASRRAAWYSAATILQRSIALELDVDSLDIEIASVHKYTDATGNAGAELYLADEHPNGAGLVYWAHSNWSKILEGCISATGSIVLIGKLMREECDRAKGTNQPWRSPDILLKGFRNRQLHGLIDWRLGMELLASMNDPAHLPGRTPFFERWGVGIPSWGEEACELADRYFNAFENQFVTRVDGPNGLHGWITSKGANGEPVTINVVTHPLWKINADGSDPISEAVINWAASLGAHALRPIDSFNLSRRMTWVRGNLHLFPLLLINFDSLSSVESSMGGWMQSLMALEVGMTDERQGRQWTRVAQQDAWTASPGVWLARMNTSPIFEVTIRNIPGAGVKIRPVGQGQPHLTREQWDELKVVARRDDVDGGT